MYGIIIAVMFGGLFAFWVRTPLFQHYQISQREQVRQQLISQFQMPTEEREYYMREYNLTYDDLSLVKFVKESASENTCLIDKNPVVKFLLGW